MYRNEQRKRPRVREGLTALLPVLEAQTGGPATRSFEACKTLAEHGEEERLLLFPLGITLSGKSRTRAAAPT